MYFEDIKYELFALIEKLESEANIEDVNSQKKYILGLTLETFNSLISIIEATISTNIFKLYEKDFFNFEFGPILSTVRIRPKKEYYEYHGKLLPRPLNPGGSDSSGIELSLNSYWNVRFHKPEIYIELCIWGETEREGFKQFYTDYRRMIGFLLNKIKSNFSTACVFKEIEKYRGNDLYIILDLYFKEKDDENNFCLRHFYQKDNLQKIIKAFLILFSLFDSCYHYISPRKKLDLFPEHYVKII